MGNHWKINIYSCFDKSRSNKITCANINQNFNQFWKAAKIDLQNKNAKFQNQVKLVSQFKMKLRSNFKISLQLKYSGNYLLTKKNVRKTKISVTFWAFMSLSFSCLLYKIFWAIIFASFFDFSCAFLSSIQISWFDFWILKAKS